MDRIEVGSKVIYKGDDRVGEVKELWQGKRALVDWGDGLPANWVPLHALRKSA